MIVYEDLVFDEDIDGASTTWYTSARFNEKLGKADGVAIHAVTTAVSGFLPTLTCQIETSGNGRDWYSAQATAEINGVAMANDASFQGVLDMPFAVVLQKHVRLRVSLGGTGPACRLKLFVTGRAFT